MPKTSELPAKLAPTGTEEIPVNDGGTSRKIAASALLDRARHIGTQLAATISDFAAAVDARITAAGLATQAALNAHTGNTANPHTVTKAQVGLGSADNTSDTTKPISTAQQAALDGKQPLAAALTQIAGLVPTNDDLIQRKGGLWVNRTVAQYKADLALTKADVGLGLVPNVDATARANHTGTQLAATVSDFDAQVRTSRLDQLAVPIAPVALNAQKLTGLADPTAAQDGATKNYVDTRPMSLDEQILNALAVAGTTHDFKLLANGFIVLAHLRAPAVAGWTVAVNAVHTVAAGKTLLVLEVRLAGVVLADAGSRQVRLRNTTDALDVMAPTDSAFKTGDNFPYLDAYPLNGFPQVAAGKTVSFDVWNIDATARGMGGVLICKEI